MATDQFAERFTAVKQRFAAKLDARIGELEAGIPALESGDTIELLAALHRRAHDLCGIGPTVGFFATGQAARAIEQLLLTALKAGRTLTHDEIELLRTRLVALRAAANAEVGSAGGE